MGSGMAAELTLASLYTVGTKGRTVGGADEGWIQEEWTGTCYFLWGKSKSCAHGCCDGPCHTGTEWGQPKCLLEETWVTVAHEALSFSLRAVALGNSLWLPRCH